MMTFFDLIFSLIFFADVSENTEMFCEESLDILIEDVSYYCVKNDHESALVSYDEENCHF